MNILVTGGADFIGSNFVQMALAKGHRILNVDALTYAGNLESLKNIAGDSAYVFTRADIADKSKMAELLNHHKPDAIVNFAAESHVDRSIDGPGAFVTTNVVGTYVMLDAALAYWRGLAAGPREAFRFVHVSTDEVYGSLGPEGRFTESSRYDPNSPYAASKAAVCHYCEAVKGELAAQQIGVSILLPGPIKSNIHQAQLNRPDHLRAGSGFAESEAKLAQREVSDSWMEPEEVGNMVADGILADKTYIVTHGIFKDWQRARAQAVLDATPDVDNAAVRGL